MKCLLLVLLICDFECFTVEAFFGKYLRLLELDVAEIVRIIQIIKLLLLPFFNHCLIVDYYNTWQGCEVLYDLDLGQLTKVFNTLFQIGSLGVRVCTDQDLAFKLVFSEGQFVQRGKLLKFFDYRLVELNFDHLVIFLKSQLFYNEI